VVAPRRRIASNLFLRYWLAIGFEGDEWLTGGQRRTLVNHARLTDKAVREYRFARECLSAFVDTERAEAAPNKPPGGVSVDAISQYMRAGDHLENCVSAVKRAGRFWYRAVEDAGFDSKIFDELFLPLKNLREKIEHGDKDFFAEGEPLFITVLAESVYLNDTELLYLELKVLIELLHLNVSVLIDSSDGIPQFGTRRRREDEHRD
jgi:hypothetical protein